MITFLGTVITHLGWSFTEYQEVKENLVDIEALASTALMQTEARQSVLCEHMAELQRAARQSESVDELRQQVQSSLKFVEANSESKIAEVLGNIHELADRMAQRIGELERQTHQLRAEMRAHIDLASLDPLTGLPNRRVYVERVEEEFRLSERSAAPLTLMVWDIDRFKLINDRFGHQAGDKVLTVFAEYLAKSVRRNDLVARLGGEEFAVLMPGVDETKALAKANTLREGLKKLDFSSAGKPVTVTSSCGLSQRREGDTPKLLFHRADMALYQAKNSGRYRCVVATGETQ